MVYLRETRLIRVLALVIVLILIATSMKVNGCWVGQTVEELFDQSRVIVIGTILEKDGHSNYPGSMMGVDHWKVEVDYYLKGDKSDSIITVDTPDNTTSLHYSLNQHGNSVLLFLNEDEHGLQPPSPQGVMGIRISEELGNMTIEKGSDLVDHISISDESTEDLPSVMAEIEQIDLIVTTYKDGENFLEDDISKKFYVWPVSLLVVCAFFVIINNATSKEKKTRIKMPK